MGADMENGVLQKKGIVVVVLRAGDKPKQRMQEYDEDKWLNWIELDVVQLQGDGWRVVVAHIDTAVGAMFEKGLSQFLADTRSKAQAVHVVVTALPSLEVVGGLLADGRIVICDVHRYTADLEDPKDHLAPNGLDLLDAVMMFAEKIEANVVAIPAAGEKCTCQEVGIAKKFVKDTGQRCFICGPGSISRSINETNLLQCRIVSRIVD